MHPSCWHAAIASAWLVYGERPSLSGSQESNGTKRKKLDGIVGGGGGGEGGASLQQVEAALWKSSAYVHGFAAQLVVDI